METVIENGCSNGFVESIPSGDKYERQWEALAGWFLGPRAENRHVFNGLMLKALNWHEDRREEFFPADPCYFTEEFKNSEAAKHEYKDMEEQMKTMHEELNKSIPFFSTRYQGHMTWDVTMPSLLGYVSGLLWNQNNVDSTASPVTTKYEIEVGQQLCKLMRFDENDVIPWGHLTSCGSVANIEATWAARNSKMHPLALKEACNDRKFPELLVGLDCPIYVPGSQAEKTLKECSNWELLNLRVDDVCSLTDNIVYYIKEYGETGKNKDEIKEILDASLKKHSLIHIGMTEFSRRHDIGLASKLDPEILTYPRVYSSGTSHYSWPKACTIVGLGDSNNITIPVDKRARQDVDALEKELEFALKHEIPVLMVVSVIGSTEESAVDDITKILQLKTKFERKGLTFCLHADAAWGGYLNCMTHSVGESDVYSNKLETEAHDFVPSIPLSNFVEKQYKNLRYADTVTIDPHKSGFCPYPAGALLYRNGTLKGFIALTAPDIFHSPNDLNVAVYGIEGSKPGAAACGVLLSHRVIGLDSNGYGRILGQCQLGAKLFYCMWETVARKYDHFICCNFAEPDLEGLKETGFCFENDEEIQEFIVKRILGCANKDLIKNRYREMDFLKIIGPDALINSFTVNCKDPKTGKAQRNIHLVNELQDLIFRELTASVGEDTKRVKLFLTTSKLEYKNYGEAAQQLKQRLNLPLEDTHDSLAFLRNTCMEPYQTSEAYVEQIGVLFRNVVYTCIGALNPEYGDEYGDPVDYHNFTIVNNMRKNGTIFLDFVPTFTKKQSQYQAIFRVIIHKMDRSTFKNIQQHNNGVLFLRNSSPVHLFQFLKGHPDKFHTMEIFKDISATSSIGCVKIQIDEVWTMRHFESSQYSEYDTHQRYFMYGDDEEAFLSHIIQKQPDFYQVVRLGGIPHSVETQLLDLGIIVKVLSVPGTPLQVDGQIIDPLQTAQYAGKYRGRQFAECVTSLMVGKPESKVYFDSDYLNGGSEFCMSRCKKKQSLTKKSSLFV